MKIAFHSYQLGERGNEICLHKYAKYNQEILGNDSIIISSSSREAPSLGRFEKDFKTLLYPQIWQNNGQNDPLKKALETIVTEEKIDIFYAIKGGENDRFMPQNCKSIAHCIFRMDEPHGDVYAGVCKYISDKHGGAYPYVFHIIEKECKEEGADLKKELNIPADAVVLGRHGGADTFNLGFVYEPIAKALDHNPNLYFVFLNTNEFYKHERVKHLPWTMDERKKARFVNTCDAMIHARFDGEIFSLSTAEFSVGDKPIITWNGQASHYDRGHIEILKDKALYYTDAQSLFDLLKNISKEQLDGKDWDAYKDIYSPSNIMRQFDNIFIK